MLFKFILIWSEIQRRYRWAPQSPQRSPTLRPPKCVWRDLKIKLLVRFSWRTWRVWTQSVCVPAAESDVSDACWAGCSRTAGPRCTAFLWGQRRARIRLDLCTGKPSPAAVCMLHSGSAPGSTSPGRKESGLQGAAKLEWRFLPHRTITSHIPIVPMEKAPL